MQKLKPCPFCGGKAKYIYQMPYNVVKCTKCKVFGKTIVDSYEQQDGKAKAIKTWNMRTEDVRDRCQIIDGLCEKCGWFGDNVEAESHNFCPGCGRKVERGRKR